MNFDFLKLKKNSLPSLKSLRPPIFYTDLYWFVSLGVCFVIILIMILVGFKLFYSQYIEDYKKSTITENLDSLINVNKLKSVIEKRNNFINKEISLPPYPSI